VASKTVTVNPLPVAAGTITGSAAVCQGQTSVTYTVPAITNATSYVWTLPTGATGSSSTNSITVFFGTSAVSGSITVKGHNDCGDGVEATKIITVNPLPATAGAITGSATVCQGQTSETYTVPAIPNATSYVWTLPAGVTGTSTTNSIIVDFGLLAVSGAITVNGHNDCGNGVADSLSITVNPLPETAGAISGSDTVCQGQTSVTYTVPAIINATSYVWTLPAGATGISTTNSINVDFGLSAVSGTITVNGHNDCGDGAADSLTITVNPLPAAPTASTTVEYCQGVIATPLTAGGNNLMWYFLPVGGIGSAVAPTPSTDVADTVHYYVSQNVDGCESSRTDLMVTILAVPDTPTITISYHDIISDAPEGNQWYGPNGLITGADSSVFSPVSEGKYFVIVTINGCSSDTSNRVEFWFSGMESYTDESTVKLYPNPVTDELIIAMDGNNEPVNFVIYNSAGAVVHKGG